jgi:hypothetical protein
LLSRVNDTEAITTQAGINVTQDFPAVDYAAGLIKAGVQRVPNACPALYGEFPIKIYVFV